MSQDYQVGVYYFPNYHIDPRNEKVHGKNWTEWELMKKAVPRFEGHAQPRVPLWGYEDEADSAVFARKIDAAAEHAIDAFIFDWYWYDDGPFLNRALEEGYLQAGNRERLQFALMWANHDWINIHPAQHSTIRNPQLLYPGEITAETFDTMVDYIITNYFMQPTYWKINGCPYFSVYQLFLLIQGFGSIETTRRYLDRFREKVQQAGFPDLHLNAVVWGIQILPGETTITDPAALLQALNIDSVTSYVWVHDVNLAQFPVTPYRDVLTKMIECWPQTQNDYPVPYYPNVTMGWDASPRTEPAEVFENIHYPFSPTMGGNSPEAFQGALAEVKAFVDSQTHTPKILTINAWNEWTEGSYLEPDTQHGMGYLEAIKTVFGKK